MAIKAKIEGNKLIITADLQTPTPSASGKNLIVCTTRGNRRFGVQIEGEALTIGLNAYIPRY